MEIVQNRFKECVTFRVQESEFRPYLQATLEKLKWDSEMLERPCGRVGRIQRFIEVYDPLYPRCAEVLARELVETSDEMGLAFLSMRVDSDIRWTQAFEAHGFRFIETVLTFQKSIRHRGQSLEQPGPVETRLATYHDLESCCEIAATALTQSRFHTDPNIPIELARRVKRNWVWNGIRGRSSKSPIESGQARPGTVTYVAYVVGQDAQPTGRGMDRVVGFIQLRGTNEGDAETIDLIAVHPDFQRQGVGRSLVNQACLHYREIMPSYVNLQVSTQATNINAIQFYQKMGFTLIRSQQTFHRWKTCG